MYRPWIAFATNTNSNELYIICMAITKVTALQKHIKNNKIIVIKVNQIAITELSLINCLAFLNRMIRIVVIVTI